MAKGLWNTKIFEEENTVEIKFCFSLVDIGGNYSYIDYSPRSSNCKHRSCYYSIDQSIRLPHTTLTTPSRVLGSSATSTERDTLTARLNPQHPPLDTGRSPRPCMVRTPTPSGLYQYTKAKKAPWQRSHLDPSIVHSLQPETERYHR